MTPHRICLIWLGSILKETHQFRIKAWRELNPEYRVELWISRDILHPLEIQSLTNFCSENGIFLHDVSELSDISEQVSLCLGKMLKNKNPNMGGLSDIYRFYILRDGGWYFDTDVIPKQPLPTNLSLPYGFALNLTKTKAGLALFPDQFVVSSQNNFIPICIEVIEHMIAKLDIDKLLHASNPQACWVHTENTTGLIPFLAILNLTFEHNEMAVQFKPTPKIIKPEITLQHVLNDKIPFETVKREFSWLTSRFAGQKIRLETNETYLNEIQRKTNLAIASVGSNSAIISIEKSKLKSTSVDQEESPPLEATQTANPVAKDTSSPMLNDFVISYLLNESFLRQTGAAIVSKLVPTQEVENPIPSCFIM